jgi:V8-like Glu-specific endopeptidase
MTGSGRTPGRAWWLALVTVATLAICQTAAHADPGDGRSQAVVVGKVRSVDRPRAFWTAKKMRQAKALPLVQLRGKASGSDLGVAPVGNGQPSYVPPAEAGAGDSPERRGRLGSSTARVGTDTGGSTAYPASANGVVYGQFVIDGQADLYRCSGSVINTSAGNIVLTAGHCVIDGDSGAKAQNLVFVPGYRNGNEPYGEWTASTFATTSKWTSTAGTANSDEAGDVAMLTIGGRSGKSLQSVVGALGIGFNQARNQTYTEYGYPADAPYDGSRLYALTSGYAGADTSFSPPTMGIASDFTGGSSGGPWVVGSAPVVLSVTDYSYVFPPSLAGYMFGPYFGTVVQQLYQSVGGSQNGSGSTSTIPSARVSILGVTHHRRSGRATIEVSVANGGTLSLSGSHLKRISRAVQNKGNYSLKVSATGRSARKLRRTGRVMVKARIRFVAPATKASSKSRKLWLIKRVHGRRH